MTPDEMKFWEAVYVAAVRAGNASSALWMANEALSNRRTKLNNESDRH